MVASCLLNPVSCKSVGEKRRLCYATTHPDKPSSNLLELASPHVCVIDIEYIKFLY
jgi:hypothetical protein